MSGTLKGKKVTVIGAARSGQAACRLCLDQGAEVTLTDQKDAKGIPDDFLIWAQTRQIRMEWGGHHRQTISQSDEVVVSPGVPYNAQPLQWAREAGIPVISEIELGYRFCRCPIIAVTGSNGKTTVSTLITEALRAAGKSACLCGNVGTPFCDHVKESGSLDYIVLEISSFQLETIKNFRPRVAVFLNFSPNHLDRHKDMGEYWQAKTRIFINQQPGDYAVLNAADPRLRVLAPSLTARAVFFETSGFSPEDHGRGWSRNPNFSAVAKVMEVCGVEERVCDQVFSQFPGVEHRLERVRTLAGVDYINDSKATTAEAGRWAMLSIDKPIVMICGGKDKNLDFSGLADLVKARVKKMIVLGETREKFIGSFRHVVDIEPADALAAAVNRARICASPGDCVLLSPMCASFDMFANFEERGRIFKEIVLTLN
jgi:UDP-N-acetylmuramoylalanine--D-glutamate ligase